MKMNLEEGERERERKEQSQTRYSREAKKKSKSIGPEIRFSMLHKHMARFVLREIA